MRQRNEDVYHWLHSNEIPVLSSGIFNENQQTIDDLSLQYLLKNFCEKMIIIDEEFANWEEFYPLVINKDKVNARGFFWYVTEVKLFEISAVLFGSNELTPTVSTSKNNAAPSEDTQQKEDQAPSPDTLGTSTKRRRTT